MEGQTTASRSRSWLHRLRWPLILLVAAGALAVAMWVARSAPSWARTRAAREAITVYHASMLEDADLIELEDALLGLGDEAIEELRLEVDRLGDAHLLKVFDGLDPRRSTWAMMQLRDHANPDIRHGALLSLLRFERIRTEEWRKVLEDPIEDRFIRQLAAHSLRLAPRWWEGLDPGVPPETKDGADQRRVTMLLEEVTLGNLVDEIAWVTGGAVSCPDAAREEKLTSLYYFHVPLEGVLRDSRLGQQYGIWSIAVDRDGDIEVTRVYSDE